MRTAYYNGSFLPEDQIKINFRDVSYTRGDGCFDTLRTFNGQPFRPKDHMKRFWSSLKYLGIELNQSQDQLIEVVHELLKLNDVHDEHEAEYMIIVRASRGVELTGHEHGTLEGPNLLVELRPIPFQARAKYYTRGVALALASLRRTPPQCVSPNAKTNSYLNQMLAERERIGRPDCDFMVMLDMDGFVCEGPSFNVFIIKDGLVCAPPRETILPGIARQTALEIANSLDLPVKEGPVSVHDMKCCDEAFITSTSMCIAPVRQFEGIELGAVQPPGPITAMLMRGYSDLAGVDYVEQYISSSAD